MCSQKSGNADNTYNANALSSFKKIALLHIRIVIPKTKFIWCLRKYASIFLYKRINSAEIKMEQFPKESVLWKATTSQFKQERTLWNWPSTITFEWVISSDFSWWQQSNASIVGSSTFEFFCSSLSTSFLFVKIQLSKC